MLFSVEYKYGTAPCRHADRRNEKSLAEKQEEWISLLCK
jgi:hypothetical protein